MNDTAIDRRTYTALARRRKALLAQLSAAEREVTATNSIVLLPAGFLSELVRVCAELDAAAVPAIGAGQAQGTVNEVHSEDGGAQA